MKVLLIGGGGREHALAWKFKQEQPDLDLIVAPGNPGIAELGRCVPVAATDIDALVELGRAERPDLTVVGPETPLALGVVDRFQHQGLAIFGPTRLAAAIEASKSFAKTLMVDAAVPTARAAAHTDAGAAKRAARELGAPVVIKATGLAAGKGVVVAETMAAADAAIDDMLVRHTFGGAGAEILVEEFMEGEEVSLLLLTDGEEWLPFLPAQDHKRLLDGDAGPNTGGMGAYAPVYPVVVTTGGGRAASGPGERWADWESLLADATDRIIEPTLGALRDAGRRFAGVLYIGLMITADGPRVVEFNCRMGDPETQAILPLTGFHLLPLMAAVARGDGLDAPLGHVHPGAAVTTVVAAAGYPGPPRTGDRIGLPEPDPGVLVFHAGTARAPTGELVSAAGRVLGITAVAGDLAAAQRASTAYAERVVLAGKQFRTDIGWRELARRARAS